MFDVIKQVGESVSGCASLLAPLPPPVAKLVVDLLVAAVSSQASSQVPARALVVPEAPAPSPAPQPTVAPPPPPPDPGPAPSVKGGGGLMDDGDDLDEEADETELEPEERAGLDRRAAGRGRTAPARTEEERADRTIKMSARSGEALETKIRNCLLTIRKLGPRALTSNIADEWKLLSGTGVKLRMGPALSRKLVQSPPLSGKAPKPWILTGAAVEWLEKHGGLPDWWHKVQQ